MRAGYGANGSDGTSGYSGSAAGRIRGLPFPVFAVLTRAPTPDLMTIHDRMPLMLPQNLIHEWILPETSPEELLQYAVTDMMAEKAGL